MAVIGTFNGASIIALPATPGFRQVEFVMNDSVAVSRSPFTGQTQTQVWPGADWIDANVTLPQLNSSDAAVWMAWLMEMRGMANVCYLYDPLALSPRGSAHGIPLVSGSNTSMTTTLATKGWKPSQFRLLEPGDAFQIGVRLHRCLEVVNSDASGNATLSVWPSIREAPADGDPVILHSPKGLFRLAENKRSRLSTETRLSAITLKFTEAR